ncbi:MAG: DUF3352 domain-containing protein [Bacteroidia bacterium]
MKSLKALFRLAFFLLLLAVAAVAGYFFIENRGEDRDPFDFIPPDFVYAIESDRPIGDWQDLSKTEVWQYLKGNAYFADITASADYLDSLLAANKTLVEFVKLGDLLISAHMVSPQTYDFVILVDLKGKGRKLPKLKPVTVSLFESLGYQVTTDRYFNIDLYHLFDPVYSETLTMAAIENVLIVSYTPDLVKRAIDQSEKTSLKENEDFVRTRDQTARNELYTLYLNFGTFERLLRAYTSEVPEMLQGLDEILSFSAFDLSMGDEKIELRGYTKQIDTAASFLRVFGDVGRGAVHAQDVLPQTTAMFTSLGFADFADFYQRFETYYRESDPDGFEDMEKNAGRVEKLLKIDFKRDFFSWMTDEIVTAVVPTDSSMQRYAYYALLHFDDYDKTKERLDYVSERIGKSPLKFEEIDYRGYPIKYLELRGFFSIFFKKLFSRIEKPHYTYIDNYVVFSNDTTALQVMIDQYLDDRVLARDAGFDTFFDRFESSSNIFTYIRNEHFYSYLLATLDAEARKGLRENREYLLHFPHVGFQLYPGGGMYRTQLYGAFEPPATP